MERHADLAALGGSRGPAPTMGAPSGTTRPLGGDEDAARPSLRAVLQSATRGPHERLHRHDGFAAVQDASIGMADYRALLARLYGFYVPFEAATAGAPCRSGWLADDLRALGLARPLRTLPTCPYLPRLDDPLLALGALYVAEGSALGGRALARGLDRLLGEGVTAGRRFLLGRGDATGAAWRGYLDRLSAAPAGTAARARIVAGAVATFAAFENWLDGWSTPNDG